MISIRSNIMDKLKKPKEITIGIEPGRHESERETDESIDVVNSVFVISCSPNTPQALKDYIGGYFLNSTPIRTGYYNISNNHEDDQLHEIKDHVIESIMPNIATLAEALLSNRGFSIIGKSINTPPWSVTIRFK